MDSERFDGLVRRFGQARSRRQALRGLAGVAAGALGARLGPGRAAAGPVTVAACTANGVRCGRNTPRGCATCCSQCTSRQENGQRRCSCCQDGRSCRRDDQCCSGRCRDGACTSIECPEGSRAINGGCFRAETCGAGSTCGDRFCGPGFASCYCTETAGGVPVCAANENFCTEGQACDADGDCPTGRACVDVSCAGCSGPAPTAVCLAPCPVSP